MHAQDGRLDRREVLVQSVGFLSKEIVFQLALYVLIGIILNWINWIWLDYDYNKLGSNWRELDYIFKVSWDDICYNVALYEKN